ncbi:hypothetical protein ACTFIV_002165 [Dictyostelium citrinum]
MNQSSLIFTNVITNLGSLSVERTITSKGNIRYIVSRITISNSLQFFVEFDDAIVSCFSLRYLFSFYWIYLQASCVDGCDELLKVVWLLNFEEEFHCLLNFWSDLDIIWMSMCS